MKKELNVKLVEMYEKMLSAGKTKSECFKTLYEEGFTVGDIAWNTKNHYSFVYGVCDSKVGVERKTEESKSDVIRKLVDSGMTPGQIAKELNSNYSYVFSVVKKYKSMKEAQ